MSDERHDDEILGRALSRAIETQSPNETAYERSRIAAQSRARGGGFWGLAGLFAGLLLAVAFGMWFARPASTLPVAASSTPTTAGATPIVQPSASAVAVVPNQDRIWVYFVRDSLPPVGTYVAATLVTGSQDPRSGRILARINALRNKPTVPTGLVNPVALVGPAAASGQTSFGMGASISGDIATVEFDAPTGWGVHGAAQVQALVQQLVYVITEEPGVRKARIIEKGKTNAVIDGLLVDRPLTREDVTDYSQPGSRKVAEGFGDATPAGSRKLTTSTSVETLAPGLARFVITTDLPNVGPTQLHPDFSVEVDPLDDVTGHIGGKWRMRVSVNGVDTTTGYQAIDKSPLRALNTTVCQGCKGVGTIYELGLDDLRPWRTALEFNPVRIIIDIGGDPRMIVDNNAVYAPGYGATVGRSFQVTGVEHNFEAGVDIRVKDDRDRELLKTSTTGTNCCDPGGTFNATVNLPASASGRIYLEVYQASPKDGSDGALIRIPLTVR